jgi:hypothetical protein
VPRADPLGVAMKGARFVLVCGRSGQELSARNRAETPLHMRTYTAIPCTHPSHIIFIVKEKLPIHGLLQIHRIPQRLFEQELTIMPSSDHVHAISLSATKTGSFFPPKARVKPQTRPT